MGIRIHKFVKIKSERIITMNLLLRFVNKYDENLSNRKIMGLWLWLFYYFFEKLTTNLIVKICKNGRIFIS